MAGLGAMEESVAEGGVVKVGVVGRRERVEGRA
jgi:hypothetical protein